MPKKLNEMKNLKWVICGIGVVLFLICLGVLLLHKFLPRHNRWNNPPMLLQVYYYKYPHRTHYTELVAMKKLSDLTTEEFAKKLLSNYGTPSYTTIGVNDEDLPFAYNVINISTPERPNHYRVNIVENLVKRTIADVEYKNEPFLFLASGENWYLAITRRLED